jgi:SAM-dependent methyltransferase
MTTSSPQYVLGSGAAELERLDQQAAVIAAPTSLLLRAAGVRPGMRVLDLGTGLGHVAFALADLVGPHGHVTAVDRDPVMLAEAERRRAERGLDHVTFLEGDVHDVVPDERVDAVVARLVLFHMPDPVAVLRHHREHALRPGGLAVMVDYDLGACRTSPAVPLVDEVLGWIVGGFQDGGADPFVGARLGPILRDAGFADRDALGVQVTFEPDDQRGPAMLAGVVATLRDRILGAGLATEADLDGLRERLADALRAHDAVVLPPAVRGAWGRATA